MVMAISPVMNDDAKKNVIIQVTGGGGTHLYLPGNDYLLCEAFVQTLHVDPLLQETYLHRFGHLGPSNLHDQHHHPHDAHSKEGI